MNLINHLKHIKTSRNIKDQFKNDPSVLEKININKCLLRTNLVNAVYEGETYVKMPYFDTPEKYAFIHESILSWLKDEGLTVEYCQPDNDKIDPDMKSIKISGW